MNAFEPGLPVVEFSMVLCMYTGLIILSAPARYIKSFAAVTLWKKLAWSVFQQKSSLHCPWAFDNAVAIGPAVGIGTMHKRMTLCI